MNEQLREELLRRAARELQMYNDLIAEGTINDEYHAERESLHVQNAQWLESEILRDGLPTSDSVGSDGVEAVLSIIQNAISLPDFQRRMLPMLTAECNAGRYRSSAAAYLEDCIRLHEGRPLLYGLYFESDASGLPKQASIEDLDGLDERRRLVGLPPYARALKVWTAASPAPVPPKDPIAKRIAYDEWRRRVGWI